MTYPGRQRRLVHAFALTLVVVAGTVAPASAKLTPVSAGVDQGSAATRHVVAGGWSGQVDAETGVPLSAGIPKSGELPAATPFSAATRHVVAGGWSGLVDAETGVPLSAGIPKSGELPVATSLSALGTANGSAADESPALEWSEALALGIGAIVVVLALGLWRGQLRRPRVAEL